jgi:hypothetical protein
MLWVSIGQQHYLIRRARKRWNNNFDSQRLFLSSVLHCLLRGLTPSLIYSVKFNCTEPTLLPALLHVADTKRRKSLSSFSFSRYNFCMYWLTVASLTPELLRDPRLRSLHEAPA